jgi:LytR cell envelope-related transcriptional attenuator
VLVVFLGLFWAVDRFMGGSGESEAARTSRPTAAAAPASSTAPASTARPTTSRTPATSASTTTEAPTTTTPPTTRSTLRPAKGVRVQVLNGGARAGAASRLAGRLRTAGYEVVSTQRALGEYPVSRVYYGAGHLEDALALQQRFPAFQVILPASEAGTGLSSKVDLSAVIGRNFR